MAVLGMAGGGGWGGGDCGARGEGYLSSGQHELPVAARVAARGGVPNGLARLRVEEKGALGVLCGRLHPEPRLLEEALVPRLAHLRRRRRRRRRRQRQRRRQEEKKERGGRTWWGDH